jgi:hypothetical protein
MIVYLKIKTQKPENVTIGVKIILIEHKDTKARRFNKNLRKSHKKFYVRFLKIIVLCDFVSLCSIKLN